MSNKITVKPQGPQNRQERFHEDRARAIEGKNRIVRSFEIDRRLILKYLTYLLYHSLEFIALVLILSSLSGAISTSLPGSGTKKRATALTGRLRRRAGELGGGKGGAQSLVPPFPSPSLNCLPNSVLHRYFLAHYATFPLERGL